MTISNDFVNNINNHEKDKTVLIVCYKICQIRRMGYNRRATIQVPSAADFGFDDNEKKLLTLPQTAKSEIQVYQNQQKH